MMLAALSGLASGESQSFKEILRHLSQCINGDDTAAIADHGNGWLLLCAR
jgi:hypothetical protein